MAVQIIDRKTVAMPGPIGTVTPELIELRNGAATDAGRAEAARTGAEAAYDGMGAVTSEGVAAAVAGPGPGREAVSARIESEALPFGGLVPRYLDIWNAFSNDSPNYSAWITNIDAMLADHVSSGRVTKADLGPSSNPARNIYAYTGGAANGLHVLLVGGTHGNEQLSQWSCREWFRQFLDSDDPTMITLRSMLRVTWVPTLTPSSYLTSRANANGVNVNRNYDLFWASSPLKEGSAPFSEPEAAAAKLLLDTYPIAAVIDCHTYASTTPNVIGFQPPSPMVGGSRFLSYTAVAQWIQLYAPGEGYYDLNEIDYQLAPTLHSWAQGYLRHQKQRYNAATISMEAPENWVGSNGWGTVSRAAIRRYCGFITLWLIQWLTEGQKPASVRPYSWYAHRSRSSTQGGTPPMQDTDVAAGGARVPSGQNGYAALALSYQNLEEDPPSSRRNYMDFPSPSPGAFLVEFSGYGNAETAAGGTLLVGVMFGFADGPLSLVDDSVRAITVPTIAGASAPFSGKVRVAGPAAADIGKRLHRVQLVFARGAAGGSNFQIRVAEVTVTPIPNDVVPGRFDGFDPLPTVRRA